MYVLSCCSIPINSCLGQAYDGASNMAGYLNGLSSQIRRKEPKAVFVHSLAHSVNLCLQDCTKSSRPVRDALALVKELYNLVQLSPKCLAWFNRLKDELAPENPTLKPLCRAKWTVRSSAIVQFKKIMHYCTQN